MRRFLLCLFLGLLLQLKIAGAQTAQDYWNVPGGESYSITFSNGQSVPISWDGWSEDWTDSYLDKTTVNDLWVTSFNYHEVQFSKFITGNIDVLRAGSYTWTIDIPVAILRKTAKFVLRFKNPTYPRNFYDFDSPELSSPGFLVLAGPPESTSTSTSTSTTTTLQTTISETPTTLTAFPPSPSGTNTSTAENDLSTGAKVGIGVGCGIAGLIILGAVVFFLIKKRSARRAVDEPVACASVDYPKFQVSEMSGATAPQELPSPTPEPAELPAVETRR